MATKAQLEIDLSDLRLKLRDEGSFYARKVADIAAVLGFAEDKNIPFPNVVNLLWEIIDAA